MELRFWGVRGSIAAPGPDTLRVGGNTTCVSLRCDDYIMVFDAGTGIRNLGRYLEADECAQWRGSIFFSHYHWDHIQGLPFFGPARREENRFSLYGEKKLGVDLEATLRQQMVEPYFPVDLDEAVALVNFSAIAPGDVVELHDTIKVHVARLLHPNDAIGFRVETPDGSLCIITDHEHPADRLDETVVEFARGADILVHEAQYTREEKAGPFAGWGHSSVEEAAQVAAQAGVGQLFLSHHAPTRTDDEVYALLEVARAVFPATEVATERTVFVFPLEPVAQTDERTA